MYEALLESHSDQDRVTCLRLQSVAQAHTEIGSKEDKILQGFEVYFAVVHRHVAEIVLHACKVRKRNC